MAKLKVLFWGVLVTGLGLWVPVTLAEESFSDEAPALSAASGTSEEMPREVMPSVNPPPGAGAPPGVALGGMSQEGGTPEGGTSGMDSSVVAAQQEVIDPFAPPPEEEGAAKAGGAGQPAAPPIKVELQGIGFGSKDGYAIIGGDVFFKGDEKNGIKLVEVRRREVDIIVNGGPMTCPLFPDQDLKNAKEREKRKRAVSAPSVEPKSEIPAPAPRREELPL